MALISGYGGTITFSGQSAVTCKSITVNYERASLEITQIGDFIEKRAPGRVKRSGSLTLYRNSSTVDDNIRAHIYPSSLANAATAVLTLNYTDQGAIQYPGSSGNAVQNIIITSAAITDDGTGAAMWELSWEQSA